MKIALLGYGKMGKTIADLVADEFADKHQITLAIDSQNGDKLTAETLQNAADVAIEFSTPETAYHNIMLAFDSGLPVVCGTTAWLHRLAEVEQRCKKEGHAFFYASNFSIGVNIFFQLNKKLAQLMNGRNDYNLQIDETHHLQKKDAPSGTAITLAQGIMATNPLKTRWVNRASQQTEEIAIVSHRLADVKGAHIVSYESPIDEIVIRHSAHSRKGFAKGAILAAEWLRGKKGVFGMEDMLAY